MNAHRRLRVSSGCWCSNLRRLLASAALLTNLYRLKNAEHILCKLLAHTPTHSKYSNVIHSRAALLQWWFRTVLVSYMASMEMGD